ncbi:copper resistance CopC family protein [Arthrobacter crystallopoietes]|uniref:CopC domain-containing protein n=1 Tax=Crystallibacter crystallopoietes TaxID=37928 RepID=A0A1H1CSF0_9MICC|nr:copper resistance CopC family protein [Arthrobacter crystallopoietes]AUI50620.1 hypothetical protein AC20117_07065 [Arthrobacter crystallopoietes]SDQ67123.1 hypothetical protein SAMN04489742_2065 [Arthrobacter crystallopoietes]
MSKRFTKTTVPAALIAALSLTLAAFIGAAPAQAHDSLLSTTPSDGETVTENPGEVTLTLSNPPLASESIESSQIEVTAPDGHVVSSGDVTIDGAVLSIPAVIDHEGEHTVVWRSVSADGHPIEGTFSFVYTPEKPAAENQGAAAPSAAAEESTAAAAQPQETTPAAQETGEAEATTATQTGDGPNTGALIAGGAILLALIAAAFLVRRKLAKK